MSSTVQQLKNQNLINPPTWLPENIHYETMMGSVAYGVSNAGSDIDVYGFGIPPKDVIFPHLAGEIQGFGRKKKKFEQWSEHHIKSLDGNKEYDFSIYSIVKFFSLCMENNPNMVDSLYTPIRCVLHSTKIGNMVRDSRKIFLHKGSYHKFRGYAHSQLHKMEGKSVQKFVNICETLGVDPLLINLKMVQDELKARSLEPHEEKNNPLLSSVNGVELLVLEKELKQCTSKGMITKRLPSIVEHGYSTKFAYHVLRLLDEAEQILELGDIDLERNREQLKSVRRGEWKIEDIKDYFQSKEQILQTTYANSKLPHSPDEGAIKQLLLDCLEEHYGDLSKCVINPDKAAQALKDIQKIIERNI